MRQPVLDTTGLVVNVVVASDEWAPPFGLKVGPPGGEVGDVWDGAAYRRPDVRPEPLSEADYGAAIQDHIDAAARARGYGNGVALASYMASTIPQWQSEAGVFVAWRDAVWLASYGRLEAVRRGDAQPPDLAELIAALPSIAWPKAG